MNTINYKPLRRKTKNTDVKKCIKRQAEGIWRNETEMTINGTANGESQEKETIQKKFENASDIQSSFP